MSSTEELQQTILQHTPKDISAFKPYADEALPAALGELGSAAANLDRLAAYCRNLAMQSTDMKPSQFKPLAEEMQNYCVQSLASVAYQLNQTVDALAGYLQVQLQQLPRHSALITAMSQHLSMNQALLGSQAYTASDGADGPTFTQKSLTVEPEMSSTMDSKGLDMNVLDGVGIALETLTTIQHEPSPSSQLKLNNLSSPQLASPGGSAPASASPSGTTTLNRFFQSVQGRKPSTTSIESPRLATGKGASAPPPAPPPPPPSSANLNVTIPSSANLNGASPSTPKAASMQHLAPKAQTLPRLGSAQAIATASSMSVYVPTQDLPSLDSLPDVNADAVRFSMSSLTNMLSTSIPQLRPPPAKSPLGNTAPDKPPMRPPPAPQLVIRPPKRVSRSSQESDSPISPPSQESAPVTPLNPTSPALFQNLPPPPRPSMPSSPFRPPMQPAMRPPAMTTASRMPQQQTSPVVANPPPRPAPPPPPLTRSSQYSDASNSARSSLAIDVHRLPPAPGMLPQSVFNVIVALPPPTSLPRNISQLSTACPSPSTTLPSFKTAVEHAYADEEMYEDQGDDQEVYHDDEADEEMYNDNNEQGMYNGNADEDTIDQEHDYTAARSTLPPKPSVAMKPQSVNVRPPPPATTAPNRPPQLNIPPPRPTSAKPSVTLPRSPSSPASSNESPPRSPLGSAPPIPAFKPPLPASKKPVLKSPMHRPVSVSSDDGGHEGSMGEYSPVTPRSGPVLPPPKPKPPLPNMPPPPPPPNVRR